jgi:hypothetical protein
MGSRRNSMDPTLVPALVAEIGEFFFQHIIPEYEDTELGVEEILDRIREDAFNKNITKKKGDPPEFWETREQALPIFMEKTSPEELDRILTYYFGIWPDRLSYGSRVFFEKLYAAIHGSLSEVRRKRPDLNDWTG